MRQIRAYFAARSVSGTALAAGPGSGINLKTPAASALPLTDAKARSAASAGRTPRSVMARCLIRPHPNPVSRRQSPDETRD